MGDGLRVLAPYRICRDDPRIVMQGERNICVADCGENAARIATALNLMEQIPASDASGVVTWAWRDAYRTHDTACEGVAGSPDDRSRHDRSNASR